MKRFPMFVLGLLVLCATNVARAVDPVPMITGPSYVTSLVGQPFSYQITATGHPTSFGSFFLYPTGGLIYDQSKGLFSGVPTGSYYFSNQPISATNGSGTGNGHLTIDVEYDLNLTRLYDIGYYPRLGRELTLGADGNFYGSGLGYDGGSYILSITPQGRVFQFFRLTGGYFFFTELITDQAGNFYGTLVQNVEPIQPPKIVRISAAGQLAILHQFTDAKEEAPLSRLCLARDGSLYGYIGDSIEITWGEADAAIFRLSPDGTYTILHRFDRATEGNAPSALVEAPDGNLYGTTRTGGPGGGGTVFEMTPTGGFTVLGSFSSDALICNPNGPLTVGSDGNLYGTAGNANAQWVATNVPQSAFYRVVPGGPVTVLRSIDPSTEGRRYPESFVRGTDGALYGLGWVGGYPIIIAQDFRRYELDGSSTSVHRFCDAQMVEATPSVGVDGNFYCLAGNGGSLGEYGSFVRIAANLSQGNHPGFFKGEVILPNGLSYLTLGNGNTFGYYGYLSDPHFIYHLDMGYEYWFDAADGHDGIYFYDFKSGSFFYTSPGFPFPYLYDFNLNTFLYYYPDPNNPSRYNTNDTRYFYNFATGQIIAK